MVAKPLCPLYKNIIKPLGWDYYPELRYRLNYADAAQLHMYLAYYRKNIMQPDDNPPIGILLCSEVGQEMAEYSLLDLDESVFISKYQLNVPSKERMTEFLRKENEGLYNKV